MEYSALLRSPVPSDSVTTLQPTTFTTQSGPTPSVLAGQIASSLSTSIYSAGNGNPTEVPVVDSAQEERTARLAKWVATGIGAMFAFTTFLMLLNIAVQMVVTRRKKRQRQQQLLAIPTTPQEKPGHGHGHGGGSTIPAAHNPNDPPMTPRMSQDFWESIRKASDSSASTSAQSQKSGGGGARGIVMTAGPARPPRVELQNFSRPHFYNHSAHSQVSVASCCPCKDMSEDASPLLRVLPSSEDASFGRSPYDHHPGSPASPSYALDDHDAIFPSVPRRTKRLNAY
jgi:hypothetical protein